MKAAETTLSDRARLSRELRAELKRNADLRVALEQAHHALSYANGLHEHANETIARAERLTRAALHRELEDHR